MTTMVHFSQPSIAVIGDSLDEVLEAAECLVRRRITSHQVVIIDDWISVDPEGADRIRERLDHLRREVRVDFLAAPGASAAAHRY